MGGLPASGLFDCLTVGGTADLAGTLALDFTDFSPPVGSTYEFLKAAAITGTFSTYQVVGLDPGLVAYDIPAGRFTIVPEPATLGLLAGGALALVSPRRRRALR